MPDLEDERLDLRERLVAREGRMVGAGGGLRRGGRPWRFHITELPSSRRRGPAVVIGVDFGHATTR